jgi:hypothetical protein
MSREAAGPLKQSRPCVRCSFTSWHCHAPPGVLGGSVGLYGSAAHVDTRSRKCKDDIKGSPPPNVLLPHRAICQARTRVELTPAPPPPSSHGGGARGGRLGLTVAPDNDVGHLLCAHPRIQVHRRHMIHSRVLAGTGARDFGNTSRTLFAGQTRNRQRTHCSQLLSAARRHLEFNRIETTDHAPEGLIAALKTTPKYQG